ncbi:MAG: Hpt domain-containing protein [Thermodesulfobacteriota bacterium]|jgi:HPt (histidine-containing phosphotransfer) domain-containing protein
MTDRAARMLEALPEIFRPLLGELLEALASGLDEASRAVSRGDMASAATAAHGLKGACMRFGLEEMARLATLAEEAARTGGAHGAAAALEAFAAMLQEVKTLAG